MTSQSSPRATEEPKSPSQSPTAEGGGNVVQPELPSQSPTSEGGGTVLQPAAPDPTAAIELDANAADSNDADSAFGDDESARSASITSSVMEYTYENGRRYHRFRQGAYLLPNDETEQDRLDLIHHVWRLALDGHLFRAPITADPQRVLDFGCGTGIWAIDFADEFPSAEVIGTDLSPIQPPWVPPNVKFYVDDVESEWLYNPDEAFDFIHGRTMAGGIKDWNKLYREVYKHLKPGGYIEMQEYETLIKSDDGSNARAPYLEQWQRLVNEGSQQFGKFLNAATDQKKYLIDAGFVDVQDDIYKIPIGSWPKNAKLKNLGRYQMEQCVSAIEPFCFGFLHKILKWEEAECRILTARVISELRDRARNHFYVNFHFVYGRKPTE